MTDAAARIRAFLARQFLFEFDDQVTPESNLFQLGLIDSYGFVELVAFLESEFNVTFTDAELVGSPLNSLAHIVTAIQGKTEHV